MIKTAFKYTSTDVHQQWLVGNAPFPLKSALKVTHPPSRNGDFDRFSLITSQP